MLKFHSPVSPDPRICLLASLARVPKVTPSLLEILDPRMQWSLERMASAMPDDGYLPSRPLIGMPNLLLRANSQNCLVCVASTSAV